MMQSYSISDISFASFLVSLGYSISSVNRRGRKVMWIFEMPQDKMAEAEAKWPSSESSKFYNIYQTLKTHIKKTPKNADQS